MALALLLLSHVAAVACFEASVFEGVFSADFFVPKSHRNAHRRSHKRIQRLLVEGTTIADESKGSSVTECATNSTSLAGVVCCVDGQARCNKLQACAGKGEWKYQASTGSCAGSGMCAGCGTDAAARHRAFDDLQTCTKQCPTYSCNLPSKAACLSPARCNCQWNDASECCGCKSNPDKCDTSVPTCSLCETEDLDSVCTVSGNGNDPSCLDRVTVASARSVCAKVGGRLCSASELKGGVAATTTCSSGRLVWTNDSCSGATPEIPPGQLPVSKCPADCSDETLDKFCAGAVVDSCSVTNGVTTLQCLCEGCLEPGCGAVNMSSPSVIKYVNDGKTCFAQNEWMIPCGTQKPCPVVQADLQTLANGSIQVVFECPVSTLPITRFEAKATSSTGSSFTSVLNDPQSTHCPASSCSSASACNQTCPNTTFAASKFHHRDVNALADPVTLIIVIPGNSCSIFYAVTTTTGNKAGTTTGFVGNVTAVPCAPSTPKASSSNHALLLLLLLFLLVPFFLLIICLICICCCVRRRKENATSFAIFDPAFRNSTCHQSYMTDCHGYGVPHHGLTPSPWAPHSPPFAFSGPTPGQPMMY